MSTVDLSLLPPPTIIETLDYETILYSIKVDLIALNPDYEAVLQMVSEPLTHLCEVVAYRELLMRERINSGAKSVMLAYATGNDLDHLVATYDVLRQTNESDAELRSRAQISFEGYSVAGPKNAYVYHAKSASPQVRDVDVSSPAGGQVKLTVLAHPTAAIPNGVPDAGLLATVLAAVSSDSVRPLCDTPDATVPMVINYTIQASIICLPGPDTQTVLAAAQQAVEKYVSDQFYLGRDIDPFAIGSVLYQPGVTRVTLIIPADHVTVADDQVAFCAGINITLGGVGQ